MTPDFFAGLVAGVIVGGACIAIGITIGMAVMRVIYGRDY